MMITDQFIDLTGCRLFVRSLTNRAENEATIVFLHEGLGSTEQWQDFPHKLCEATGVNGVVYDRHGYGKSSPLTEQRDATYLKHEGEKLLPELIDAMNLNQTILFGHSDGGSIALYTASLTLPNVLGAIIEAPHVHLDELSISGITKAKKAFERGNLRRALAAYHGDKTESMFYGWAGTWLSPEFRHWHFHDALKKIECPLLLIQGDQDQYGKRQQLDTIKSCAKGRSEILYIENCGHAPHQEAQTLVLEKSKEFISQLFPHA